VEDVLLPSLAEIGDRHGTESAPWALAARWAEEWLLRSQRLSPAPNRGRTVVFGNATRRDGDPDVIVLRALELCVARGGIRPVTLPVGGLAGLGDLLAGVGPQAVVIVGGEGNDDEVARWAYRVRSTAGALPVLLFHRAGRTDRTRTTGARQLSPSPTQAAVQIAEVLEGGLSAAPEGGAESQEIAIPVAPRRRRLSA
jgi:hypothetical protein